MRAILDQLEKAGERIHELGKGELSGIFKINDDCKSVVFVVDRSGSMSWNNSLERVKSEMAYGIAQLKPEQSFGVIFFDDGVYTMSPNFSLAKATPANVKAVEAWMQTIFPAGGTTPYPAMELALSVHPELIILLSDGDNTQNRTSSSASAIDARQRLLCDNAKAAGITIYTIQVNTNNDNTSSVMSYCASSTSNYFATTSASGINTAFSSIGSSLSKLRIAK